VLVHQAQPAIVNIEDAAAEFRPVVVRDKTSRVHQRLVDGEVLLESNLAFHVPLLTLRIEYVSRSNRGRSHATSGGWGGYIATD
jgi:hypothetical protein